MKNFFGIIGGILVLILSAITAIVMVIAAVTFKILLWAGGILFAIWIVGLIFQIDQILVWFDQII